MKKLASELQIGDKVANGGLVCTVNSESAPCIINEREHHVYYHIFYYLKDGKNEVRKISMYFMIFNKNELVEVVN